MYDASTQTMNIKLANIVRATYMLIFFFDTNSPIFIDGSVTFGFSESSHSMGDEKNAFYVVRKGGIVGIYKSLSDCQALALDGNASISKGYSLSSIAEEHLALRGLKNAAYSISADDVNNELFGKLVACPFQHPQSSKDSSNEARGMKRPYEVSGSYHVYSCILEFDGAAKGNPGPAGAGAVLRSEDGRKVCHLREGVGIATNNVAEYRALILGLRHAVKKGYNQIRVHGDSLLVCNQIQGLWKTKNQRMADLCQVAKDLKSQFRSFQINHVLRDFNSDADAQANLAIYLRDGQVEEDCQ